MKAAVIRQIVTDRLAQELGLPADSIDPDATAADLGLGSAGALRLAGRLEQDLGRTLAPHILFDYPTINRLAQALALPDTAAAIPEARVEEPIAIVGIGCRFPGGVTGPSQFLAFLRASGDGIGDVPAERWDRRLVEREAGASMPGGKAGLLHDIDRFDASLFGILPAEAVDMDPQQRLLLETGWQALEDAGLDPRALGGSRTGVFVGISANEYDRAWPVDLAGLGASSPASAALSIAANRLSYAFDLRGPSVAVDTACSSSLSAIHLACQALRGGEAELALAGGVNAVLAPDMAVAFGKAGLMAADGYCKTFDDRADGYVRGEGCGLVVLKRLSDARRDGDPVYAVILGMAVGQDGRSNGLMAPRGEAQSAVIAAACAKAGIDPAEIDYLEAHGTGTAVGDVIEAHAISAVAAPGRSADRPLRLGSVKSNIGHLEAAAGAAGLIKTALCLAHKELLPGRHFARGNSRIDFARLQLDVVQHPATWPGGKRRIAGVSSFGFGGTNVHAVLAEDDGPPLGQVPQAGSKVLQLSGNTPEQLALLAGEVADSLAGLDDAALDPFLESLARRHPFSWRAAMVADSRAHLVDAARALAASQPWPGLEQARAGSRPKIGLLFSGQGALWAGAGLDLFEASAVYRNALIACDERIRGPLGRSVLEILFGSAAESDISRTEWAQPALFAIQYALTAELAALGISPAGVVGHSVGEVAAACAAGRISLDDAAQLIVRRGAAMADTAGTGRMLAVRATPDQVSARIHPWAGQLVIAAVNGPNAVVVSGESAAIAAFAQSLRQDDIASADLGLDYAFHSPQMDQAAARCADWPELAVQQDGDCQFYSSTLGERGDGVLDNAYWSRSLRDPVQFAPAIGAMQQDGFDLFIEVGPSTVLARGVAQMTGKPAIGLMQNRTSACASLARARAALFVSGGINRPAPNPRSGRALGLPPSPMAGDRFWRERKAAPSRRAELMGPVLTPAFAPDQRLRAGELSLKSAPFLRDHVIQGQVLLPAAGTIGLFAAAGADRPGQPQLALGELALLEAVPVASDSAIPMQLSWQDQAEPALALHRQDKAGTWRKFASAKLLDANPQDRAEALPIGAILARCLSNFPAPLFYELMRNKGLEYGPGYRLVTEIHACRGEALARLDHGQIAGRTVLDPQVLDACLHPVAAAISPKQLQDRADRSLFVPAGVASIVIEDRAAEPWWSHAVITERGDDRIVADVTILDQAGRPLAVLSGLALRSMRPARASDGLFEQALGSWIYGLGWIDAAEPEATSVRQPATVMLLCDRGGLGDAVASACLETGARVIRLKHGAALQAEGSDQFTVPAGSREAFDQVLAQAGLNEIDTIIDLWPLDTRYGACATAQALDLGPKSLVALVQALEGSSLRGTGHLTVVTGGAVAVTENETSCPHQGTIAGLIRAIGIEHPGLRCKTIDVEKNANPARIVREACTSDGESQLALRANRRLAARLRSQPTARAAPPVVRGDAAYLITGGMGALGLTAAKALAAAGARYLILAGRSEPRGKAGDEIALLRNAGVHVRIAQVDVGDRSALEAMLADHPKDEPPLAGIIHCAGLLDDCAIANLLPERLDQVVHPKLIGALNLHEATLDQKLDFFVSYSSAAAVLGAPGQANYCCANAGLDALALHRKQLGLPGLALGWGAWAQSGMAKDASAGIVASTLVSAIPHEVGAELLSHLLTSESGYRLIVPFSIPSLLQFYPSSHGLKLFAEIAGSKLGELRSEGARESRYRRPALSTAFEPPVSPIEQRIMKIWESSLNIEGIGINDDIFELGGDSVLANQILSKIAEVYGVRVEGETAFTSFTIANLAQLVDDELLRFVEEMAGPFAAEADECGERELSGAG